MASLEKRSGKFRVVFRYAGQKYSRSLRTRSEIEARAAVARLEDNLRRLGLGLLEAPEEADLALFLLSDGRRSSATRPTAIRTLKPFCDAYFAALPPGSIEPSTIATMKMHARHLQRIFGESFAIQSLVFGDLQRYVAARAQEEGHRSRKVSGTTIRKDLVSFATIWRWGVKSGILQRPFPNDGLRFPKTTEKPRFQTWEEIERRIARGGLTAAEEADLWDCLFLTLSEIEELLGYVKQSARQPFIYPMFCFAAHTGARRSEIIRSQIDDLDFVADMVTIHEKKRVRGKHTTRQVPLSPFLASVLRAWLDAHPAGNQVFCQVGQLPRSKTKREPPRPLTRDEAHDHFKRTLAGSKWEKLRGWHVFRHSFCSNCAAKGIDQRLINAWVGHQTEDMVRRYRHLIPNQQQEAIRLVFGGVPGADG